MATHGKQPPSAEHVEQLERQVRNLSANVRKLTLTLESAATKEEVIQRGEQLLGEIDKRNEELNIQALQIAANRPTREESKRRAKRTLLLGVAIVVPLMFTTIYSALLLQDVHVQDCLVEGPQSESERRACDWIFWIHNHPRETSIESIIEHNAKSELEICEARNRQTDAQITLLKGIAKVASSMRVRAVLERELKAITALRVDCSQSTPKTVGSQ